MTTEAVTLVPERPVAVIITCYNEGAYIGAAVQSVLDQSRADLIDCIVIADDGSGPDTIAVLKTIECRDPRIRVIYGAGRAGISAQRNLAIRSTHAPILAILDGDDLWRRDKLKRQLPALSDPTIGLVYAGYFTFTAEIRNAHRAVVRDITSEPDLPRAFFLNDPPIIPSAALIRRSAFEACGGYDSSIPVFEDSDLHFRLARVCRFAFVDAPLLYKRNHAGSITGGRRKDLMAYHALVALKAAADDARILALVPRRLAERARKLGNHYFLMDDPARARPLLRFATQLDPRNLRAWGSLIVAVCFPRAVHLVMASRWRARRAALGVTDSVRKLSDAPK